MTSFSVNFVVDDGDGIFFLGFFGVDDAAGSLACTVELNWMWVSECCLIFIIYTSAWSVTSELI